VRDSRARIVDASVTERRRLERNLHDGAQQRLVTLSLHLRMAQVTLQDDPPGAEAILEGVGDDLKLALEELRELARGLHPAVLTDRGLVPALQSLANRSPFPVAIAGVPAVRLPEPVEAALYYVVAESLTNAAKHSHATKGSVELSTTPGSVTVEIRDNGSGGANLTRGSGLRGLADRVEALGGKLRFQSPAGGGTAVQAELPLH
jgi:signal transduction histidine kinase